MTEPVRSGAGSSVSSTPTGADADLPPALDLEILQDIDPRAKDDLACLVRGLRTLPGDTLHKGPFAPNARTQLLQRLGYQPFDPALVQTLLPIDPALVGDILTGEITITFDPPFSIPGPLGPNTISKANYVDGVLDSVESNSLMIKASVTVGLAGRLMDVLGKTPIINYPKMTIARTDEADFNITIPLADNLELRDVKLKSLVVSPHGTLPGYNPWNAFKPSYYLNVSSVDISLQDASVAELVYTPENNCSPLVIKGVDLKNLSLHLSRLQENNPNFLIEAGEIEALTQALNIEVGDVHATATLDHAFKISLAATGDDQGIMARIAPNTLDLVATVPTATHGDQQFGAHLSLDPSTVVIPNQNDGAIGFNLNGNGQVLYQGQEIGSYDGTASGSASPELNSLMLSLDADVSTSGTNIAFGGATAQVQINHLKLGASLNYTNEIIETSFTTTDASNANEPVAAIKLPQGTLSLYGQAYGDGQFYVVDAETMPPQIAPVAGTLYTVVHGKAVWTDSATKQNYELKGEFQVFDDEIGNVTVKNTNVSLSGLIPDTLLNISGELNVLLPVNNEANLSYYSSVVPSQLQGQLEITGDGLSTKAEFDVSSASSTNPHVNDFIVNNASTTQNIQTPFGKITVSGTVNSGGHFSSYTNLEDFPPRVGLVDNSLDMTIDGSLALDSTDSEIPSFTVTGEIGVVLKNGQLLIDFSQIDLSQIPAPVVSQLNSRLELVVDLPESLKRNDDDVTYYNLGDVSQLSGTGRFDATSSSATKVSLDSTFDFSLTGISLSQLSPLLSVHNIQTEASARGIVLPKDKMRVAIKGMSAAASMNGVSITTPRTISFSYEAPLGKHTVRVKGTINPKQTTINLDPAKLAKNPVINLHNQRASGTIDIELVTAEGVIPLSSHIAVNTLWDFTANASDPKHITYDVNLNELKQKIDLTLGELAATTTDLTLTNVNVNGSVNLFDKNNLLKGSLTVGGVDGHVAIPPEVLKDVLNSLKDAIPSQADMLGLAGSALEALTEPLKINLTSAAWLSTPVEFSMRADGGFNFNSTGTTQTTIDTSVSFGDLVHADVNDAASGYAGLQGSWSPAQGLTLTLDAAALKAIVAENSELNLEGTKFDLAGMTTEAWLKKLDITFNPVSQITTTHISSTDNTNFSEPPSNQNEWLQWTSEQWTNYRDSLNDNNWHHLATIEGVEPFAAFLPPNVPSGVGKLYIDLKEDVTVTAELDAFLNNPIQALIGPMTTDVESKLVFRWEYPNPVLDENAPTVLAFNEAQISDGVLFFLKNPDSKLLGVLQELVPTQAAEFQKWTTAGRIPFNDFFKNSSLKQNPGIDVVKAFLRHYLQTTPEEENTSGFVRSDLRILHLLASWSGDSDIALPQLATAHKLEASDKERKYTGVINFSSAPFLGKHADYKEFGTNIASSSVLPFSIDAVWEKVKSPMEWDWRDHFDHIKKTDEPNTFTGRFLKKPFKIQITSEELASGIKCLHYNSIGEDEFEKFSGRIYLIPTSDGQTLLIEESSIDAGSAAENSALYYLQGDTLNSPGSVKNFFAKLLFGKATKKAERADNIEALYRARNTTWLEDSLEKPDKKIHQSAPFARRPATLNHEPLVRETGGEIDFGFINPEKPEGISLNNGFDKGRTKTLLNMIGFTDDQITSCYENNFIPFADLAELAGLKDMMSAEQIAYLAKSIMGSEEKFTKYYRSEIFLLKAERFLITLMDIKDIIQKDDSNYSEYVRALPAEYYAYSELNTNDANETLGSMAYMKVPPSNCPVDASHNHTAATVRGNLDDVTNFHDVSPKDYLESEKMNECPTGVSDEQQCTRANLYGIGNYIIVTPKETFNDNDVSFHPYTNVRNPDGNLAGTNFSSQNGFLEAEGYWHVITLLNGEMIVIRTGQLNAVAPGDIDLADTALSRLRVFLMGLFGDKVTLKSGEIVETDAIKMDRDFLKPLTF